MLGSFFWDQALALRQAGHKVVILYSDTYSVKYIWKYACYMEEESEECDGIQIYRMKIFCPLKHGIEGYREAFAKGILRLYDRYNLSNESFDVLHAHGCVWAGYAAMKLSEKTGIPYIITEHVTLFGLHKDQISQMNDQYIRQAFEGAAKVICVSHAFARLISKYRTLDDIEVVGNVIDFEQFRPCKDQEHSEMRFLSICYMDTQDQFKKKGMDILLEAWRGFSAEYDTAKLIIGGGGRATQKAAEWCRKHGLDQTVTFIGRLSREQVVEQMQTCDVFVLPSRYETFGVVYIEAIACGKPVIAAANGGPDDFVTDRNGILIPPDDIESLQNALTKMCLKRNDYHSDAVRETVINRFSASAVAVRLEEIYRKTLERGDGQ